MDGGRYYYGMGMKVVTKIKDKNKLLNLLIGKGNFMLNLGVQWFVCYYKKKELYRLLQCAKRN